MIALDSPMVFTVERDGKEMELTATPKRETFADRFGFEHSRGVLGLIGAVNGFNVDTVIAVDGKEVKDKAAAIATIKKSLGRTTEVTFKGVEAEKNSILIVAPFKDLNANLGKTDDPKDQMIVISEKVGGETIKHPPLSAIGHAIMETKEVTVGTLTALGQIVTGTRSAKELGGLIRIGAMAGDMAQAGIIAVLTFTALLSINLGLINLFPIPVLDGGHLVFYALEAIKGSPVPEKAQEYAFRVGFTLLIAIMVFANLSDILQLIL
jgi:regulator of sigma E protease